MSASVLVFSQGFPPAYRGGGPIRSVAALVRDCPPEFEPHVFVSCQDLGTTVPLPVRRDVWVPWSVGEVYYCSVNVMSCYLRGLWASRGKNPKLLHFNSVFSPRFTIMPLLLAALGFWGRPRILLSPRGEFGRGALGKSPTRKRVYLAVFRLLRLHRRVVWHATSGPEAGDIRRLWGASVPVIVRVNGTDLPTEAHSPALASSALRLAFASRLTSLKGLLVVIEALQDCSGGIELDVYGLEEDKAYVARCREAVAVLPRGISVRFHGAVPHEELSSALAEHEGFLLPTAGENFGHVVIEALWASCIVLVTPTTPWTERVRAGGGMLVSDRSPAAWAAAITAIQALSPEERLALRRRAGQQYEAWARASHESHLWTVAAAGRAGRSTP